MELNLIGDYQLTRLEKG